MDRDIYRAIMIAAAKGRGLKLTADEAFALSMDDAISTRAANSITEEDWVRYSAGWKSFWYNQSAMPTIGPANLAGYARDDPERASAA